MKEYIKGLEQINSTAHCFARRVIIGLHNNWLLPLLICYTHSGADCAKCSSVNNKLLMNLECYISWPTCHRIYSYAIYVCIRKETTMCGEI